LCRSERGSHDLHHLSVQTPDGTITDLTSRDELKAMFLGWAPDEPSFWVTMNGRDRRFFDAYGDHAATDLRGVIYANPERRNCCGISLDGWFLR
jgi:hypothetical protein